MDLTSEVNCTFIFPVCEADASPVAKAAYADLFRCRCQRCKHLSLIRFGMPLAISLRLDTYTLDGYRVGEMNPTPAVAILVPQAIVGCSGGFLKQVL